MAKVFISHRTVDMLEAIRLAEAIRSAGHNVWLDDWEIAVGDNIVERINKGLNDADYVALCLSAHGVMSKWISQEWMTTLARQLNSESVKLLPVRLTGDDLPAILAGIRYADLAASWSKGLSSLLKAIR
ncbi:MAG: toll/interleukin-1 receptor domain-containing protein [Pyrinomonadaceae bacterium]